MILNDRIKKLLNKGSKDLKFKVEVDKYVYDPNRKIGYKYRSNTGIINTKSSSQASNLPTLVDPSETNNVPTYDTAGWINEFKSVESKNNTVAVTNNANISSVGTLISPIDGKSIGELKVTFGFNEIYRNAGSWAERTNNGTIKTNVYNGAHHFGTDIAGVTSDAIVASASGWVVSTSHVGSTQHVAIQVKEDFCMYYLHLDNVMVNVGDFVEQGQQIANLYNYSSGVHLHLEAILNMYDKSYFDGNIRDDIMKYLRNEANVVDVPATSFDSTMSGTVNTQGARLRYQPNVDSDIITSYNTGDSVTIMGKEGEWYKIDAGSAIVGYMHYKLIDVASGSDTTIRGGNNPSYTEVYDFVIEIANREGIDARGILAMLWQESEWTQFNADGTTFMGDNGDSYGMSQINRPAWGDQYDFDKLSSEWDRNCRAGSYIYIEYYVDAVRSSEPEPHRAAYSMYNGGPGSMTRYRTANPPLWQDTQYFEKYTNQPWLAKISNVGGNNGTPIYDYGQISAMSASIKETKDIAGNVLEVFNKGYILECIAREDDWYKVKTRKGVGYVHKNDYNLTNFPLSNEYTIVTMIDDTFESGVLPPNYISPGSAWVNEGEYLKAIGGGEGISKDVYFYTNKIYMTGRLNISCFWDVGPGMFIIYIDSIPTMVYTGTSALNDISLNLGAGCHTIKLSIVGASIYKHVSIERIKVVQFINKPGNIFEDDMILTNTESEAPSAFVNTSDIINIYSSDNINSQIIGEASRGTVLNVDGSNTNDSWTKVKLSNGTIGYVETKFGSLNTSEQVYNTVIANTGGFKFDRTIELDNVISITVDYRHDLRLAEADLVIENIDSMYSPDYKFMEFPEAGLRKSVFADYYTDHIIGVLAENTPIRIYAGYDGIMERVFTGAVDSISVSSNHTISIKCSDMMRLLQNFVSDSDIHYPDGPQEVNKTSQIAWMASSVVQDLAKKAGMASWRMTSEDRMYADMVVEETYISDILPKDGKVVKYVGGDIPEVVEIQALPDGFMFRTPAIIPPSTIESGTNIADWIEEKCNELGYWQRCDRYGTYRFTSVHFREDPVFTFTDKENIITVDKSFNYNVCRNHIIILDGKGDQEHFFDRSLWIASKGQIKTCKIEVTWAEDYGQKRMIAAKMFRDMKMAATTVRVEIEGNPFIDIYDTVKVVDRSSNTNDIYVVKGITHNINDSGFKTNVDMSFLKRSKTY